MPKTPDSSYWGNPPETPRANHRFDQSPSNQAPQAPQMPYGSPFQQQGTPTPNTANPTQGYVPQHGQSQTAATQAYPEQHSPNQSQGQPSVSTNQDATTPVGQPAATAFANNAPTSTPEQSSTSAQKQTFASTPGQNFVSPPMGHYSAGASTYKPKRGIITAILIVVFMVIFLLAIIWTLLGGVASSVSSQAPSITESLNIPTPQEPPSTPSAPSDPSTALNNEYTRALFGLTGNASFTTDDLDYIESLFPSTIHDPDSQGNYPNGVYFVGRDIPEGSYWLEGNDASTSNFFILQPSKTTDGAYDVVLSNSYYGHNIMDLHNNEVFILANNSTFMPLENMTETFSAPYGNGVYRVGTDIPAGTYRLGLGKKDDYSACYVMKDLNYTDDSYLYEAYYITGDKPDEITLTEGTYVELYNMSASPVTA